VKGDMDVPRRYLVVVPGTPSDYGTPVFPDTYVIDRHGKILRKFFGPQQWDSPDMLAYFDAVLGKT